MKHRSVVLIIAFCSALALSLSTSRVARGTEVEKSQIDARAAEIAHFLPDAPNFGARTMDREYWSKLASTSSGKRAIQAAENELKSSPPQITEELYKEFYRNGNRSRYQSAFSRAEGRFVRFALAEALEGEGRFLEPLEDSIRFFLTLPSWVLPAHDYDGAVYDGKATYSDLGSTLAAGNLAIALNLHGDKLSPETVAAATQEIERRVLAPYEEAVAAEKAQRGMWWVRTENNWNAVCCAGTVAAALNVVESKERRAFFVAASEYFSEHFFLKGFTNDGYCSEGMGYWDYGFGNYVYLGALVRNATQGKIDFFRFPKIRPVLDYAPNLELDKGDFVAFADCSLSAKPDPIFVGYVSRLKGFGYSEYETRGLGDAIQLGDLIKTTSIAFDRDVAFPEKPVQPKKYNLPVRTDFPDAGVLICRPDATATGDYFAIAFKGGHNAEMHNHNDVGSYSILLGSNAGDGTTKNAWICRDPGGETYTARTFSSRRYEGELLNSFGHPVPRIAGTLQRSGANAKGVFIEKTLSDERDVATIDLTSAYPVPDLERATRTFEYERARNDQPGWVAISDYVEFKEGKRGAFETALITFEKDVAIEERDDALVLRVNRSEVVVRAFDRDGAPLKVAATLQTVGEKDDSVPNKPTRVALAVQGDVDAATIVQRFEVAQ